MSREAIRRLEEDFRFVGVQDHWRASVQRALAEFNASSSAELVESAQARHQYTKSERAAALARRRSRGRDSSSTPRRLT